MTTQLQLINIIIIVKTIEQTSNEINKELRLVGRTYESNKVIYHPTSALFTCTRVRDEAATSVRLLSGTFQFSGDTWSSCLQLARSPVMAVVKRTHENSHHCRVGQQAQRSVLYGNIPSPLGSLRDRTSEVHS